jgi:hypothetical protein
MRRRRRRRRRRLRRRLQATVLARRHRRGRGGSCGDRPDVGGAGGVVHRRGGGRTDRRSSGRSTAAARAELRMVHVLPGGNPLPLLRKLARRAAAGGHSGGQAAPSVRAPSGGRPWLKPQRPRSRRLPWQWRGTTRWLRWAASAYCACVTLAPPGARRSLVGWVSTRAWTSWPSCSRPSGKCYPRPCTTGWTRTVSTRRGRWW